MKNIKLFGKKETGATLVEYALIVALLSIAVTVTVMLVRDALNDQFTAISECVADPQNAC